MGLSSSARACAWTWLCLDHHQRLCSCFDCGLWLSHPPHSDKGPPHQSAGSRCRQLQSGTVHEVRNSDKQRPANHHSSIGTQPNVSAKRARYEWESKDGRKTGAQTLRGRYRSVRLPSTEGRRLAQQRHPQPFPEKVRPGHGAANPRL